MSEGEEEIDRLRAHLSKVQANLLTLARMVVRYFGDEKIPPQLDGDIRLRDTALAMLDQSTQARIDPS